MNEVFLREDAVTEHDVGEIDVWAIDGEPELDGVYVTLVVGCDIAQENVVVTVLDVEGTVMTPSNAEDIAVVRISDWSGAESDTDSGGFDGGTENPLAFSVTIKSYSGLCESAGCVAGRGGTVGRGMTKSGCQG